MATKDVILQIKKAHFTVKLHPNLLEVDLKEGLRKELEDVLESSPAIRRTLGYLFQFAVPLDIPLKDIDSATVNEQGHVKIAAAHRRDIHIPLKVTESKKLVSKLNELIPIEKAKAVESILLADKAKRETSPTKGWAEYIAEHEGRIPK